MTTRVQPPAAGASINVNGHSYKSPAGNPINVPDADVAGMVAAGWVNLGTVGSGPPTAAVHAAGSAGNTYIDQTTGKVYTHDGSNYRDVNGKTS